MDGKIRIALLLTVSFILCSALAVFAAGVHPPDIRLSSDKLRFKKGGPKAATISQTAQQSSPPSETPEEAAAAPTKQQPSTSAIQRKAETVTLAAQQAPAPPAKRKAETVTQAAQQAPAPPETPKAAALPAKRHAPSFDCAKASDAVERAICADPALAEMDVMMAADYKKALRAVADRRALRTEQRQWLRQMHSQCANGAFQCIQQHYGARSTQLRAYY